MCCGFGTEKQQCRDCEIEAKKHCDECGGYGSEEDEEEEWDVCEPCNDMVLVTYDVTCKGYSIANCDVCNTMCCRNCLDKGGDGENPECPKCKDK